MSSNFFTFMYFINSGKHENESVNTLPSAEVCKIERF